MRKSKATDSAAVCERASKAVQGSAGPENSGAASKPKRATKCRVPKGKITRPVQHSIFDYAAAIGVNLLPEVS